MNINWKVRLKNKVFWVTVIPMALLFVQTILALLGYEIDLGEVGNRLLDVVNAIFGLLGAFGIVIDPTTSGINDSIQAMEYTEPKVSE